MAEDDKGGGGKGKEVGIAPGEEDKAGAKGDEGTKPEEGAEDDESRLGDAGKKALDAERKARGSAEKEAKAAKAELEKLRNEHASEADKAIAKAREEGKSEALTTANARLVRAEVMRLATGKLADASDAAALLDLSTFEVDDSGNVDDKAITSAIEELVKNKPHLAAKPKRPEGDGGGGPRGADGEGKPKSMDDWLRAQVK